VYCSQKRNLYPFTENNNDPKAKIPIKVTKAKKQHYSGLIAKSNDIIKTWNIIKKDI
jgi:hypothetical protein